MVKYNSFQNIIIVISMINKYNFMLYSSIAAIAMMVIIKNISIIILCASFW